MPGAIGSRDAFGMSSVQPQVTGARLLARDVGVVTLLLNDARYRTFQRVFAVEKNDVNLVTLIALLVMAERMQAASRKVRAGRGPTLTEDFLGFGIVREALCRVAGPDARDTPLLASLLAIAVIGATARSGLRSVHGSGHRADVAFHKRYGYLVDPGHWRQRRAQRREVAIIPR